MKKRIVSLLLVFALLIAFPALGASAKEPLHGVALGDSIPAHYGVTEQIGYVSQLRSYLAFSGIQCDFVNLAVSGYDTGNLLAQLTDDKVLAELKDADIITLNIGGNNLLIPLIEIVVQEMKAQGVDDIMSAPMSAILSLAVKKLTAEQMAILEEGADALEEDFPKIIGALQKAAPDAVIYANTVYNPVPAELGIYEATETLISRINGSITGNSAEGGYAVVDVYSAFKASGESLTNFNIASGSIDIHPNASGHALIAKLIGDKITNPVYITHEDLFAIALRFISTITRAQAAFNNQVTK